MSTSDFYLRYYVGHKGKFGHEFLEFEFRPDGKRGANFSLLNANSLSIEFWACFHAWPKQIFPSV